MHKMIKVLTDLGVDFEAKEHKSYHFKAAGMMDLIVEVWPGSENCLHLSLAHYGKQNGDAIADPEMEFFVYNGLKGLELAPIHFQNDFLGIFQLARFKDENGVEKIRPHLILELRAFAKNWARTLDESAYA